MLRLRDAVFGDWARLFAWRNDDDAVAASRNTEVISLDAHLTWLRNTLATPNIRILIAHDVQRSVYVGYLRLAILGDTANVSIAVDAKERGKGYGLMMLHQGRLFCANGPRTWIADVRNTNIASLRLFVDAGFELEGTTVASPFVRLVLR